ncbi:hypothetical protein QFZ74_002126 [Streptomyces sp. V3I7]|nr:hypothetical protein [Streptomyces sp. V3I7]
MAQSLLRKAQLSACTTVRADLPYVVGAARIHAGGYGVCSRMDAIHPRKSPDGPQPPPQAQGCLVVAIRLPVRIVALVLVVPVRMLWDALVVAGRFLTDTVLRPVGRVLLWLGRAVFVWPWVALWRYVAVPVGRALLWLGRVLVVVPLGWLHRSLLTPLGHGIAWLARGVGAALKWLYVRLLTPLGHGIAWLARGVGAALKWLYVRVLTPVGRALAWCADAVATGVGAALYWTARVLFVLPARALWRSVLVPVGRVLAVVAREIGEALGHAWRIAGHLARAVGRFLATLFRWIVVEPVRWVYRTVVIPVGHVVRDAVLRPVAEAARAVGQATGQALVSARATVRQARADARRMLFGEPRPLR